MMTFRAMNSNVAVIADDAAAHAIRQTFVAAEQRFSRFREDSELMRLNRATEPMIVHGMLASSDAAHHGMRALYAGSGVVVTALVAIRIAVAFRIGARQHGHALAGAKK